MGKIIVFGSLNFDISVYSQRMPQNGETIMGQWVRHTCGGKGANQAFAACRAEAPVLMVGCVGEDAYGSTLTEQLAQAGVDVNNITRDSSLPSGLSLINIDEQGNNRIVVIPGANSKADPANLGQAIEANDILLLQNEVPLAANEAAVSIAKAQGASIIYNPAPYLDLPPSLYQHLDYLVPNEHELALLVPQGETLEEKARVLLRQGVKQVVVTLGDQGAMLVNASGVSLVPTHQVAAIDSVGAGDCFCGYFAAALCQGADTVTALRQAVAAASISVQHPGAQDSYPDRAQVDAFLAEHPTPAACGQSKKETRSL